MGRGKEERAQGEGEKKGGKGRTLAAGKGRPDGRAVLVVVKERLELDLELLAVEDRVLRLLDARPDKAETVGDGDGLLNLLRRPFAGPVVERPALIEDVVERANDFLHRRGGVVTVSEDDVDVVHPKALERRLDALDDVLARQALLVRV